MFNILPQRRLEYGEQKMIKTNKRFYATKRSLDLLKLFAFMKENNIEEYATLWIAKKN